jgi:hypothetical protein
MRPPLSHCATARSRLNTEDVRDWPGGNWMEARVTIIFLTKAPIFTALLGSVDMRYPNQLPHRQLDWFSQLAGIEPGEPGTVSARKIFFTPLPSRPFSSPMIAYRRDKPVRLPSAHHAMVAHRRPRDVRGRLGCPGYSAASLTTGARPPRRGKRRPWSRLSVETRDHLAHQLGSGTGWRLGTGSLVLAAPRI